MDTADTLMAMEQIRQLKARYFRFMDTKDWTSLRTIFCDDAVFDARASLSLDGKGESGRAAESNDWVTSGGDAIIDFIRTAVGTQHSVHHGHCHEVTVTGPDTAEGVIAMEDIILDEARSRVTLHGCGHYHETYRKQDGQWRIATSRITRLHVVLDIPVF